MIRAEGLRRDFGGRLAVDNISFEVEPGEVVGFLGPNGAGKTTTMRMLLGLLTPTAGAGTLTRPVGYLPEVFAAYEALSVEANLRYLAAMKGVAREAVAEALDASAAGELARRPLGRLSKGQRQRVGLAQAVLGRPPTYVLDEPMQGLDPSQVVEARALVRSLADAGAAVLVSTHALAEAATTCDRVVVVVRGRVVAEERPGTATDLEERFLRLVGEAELGDVTP